LVPADLFDEVVLEPGELPVVERRVNGRDQIPAQPEDRDDLWVPRSVVGHGFPPRRVG
jgi:hypothetical protein